MTEQYGDIQLMRLTPEAKMLDTRLAELQPIANASLVGSKERRRYSELRDRSKTAWQLVMDRVMDLMSLTNDLRQPLPEDGS